MNKLYGGTKTEMERLIKDANEYAAANGQAADLSIDSFADIVSAIDLIQQKQNIAGTTSREAASTIEGSLNMVKGAWTNLVAGFANPDADIGELLGDVVESAEIAMDNLLPAVTEGIKGIGSAFSELTPVLLEKVPALVANVAPAMGEAGIALVESLVDALMEAGPQMFDAAIGMIENLSSGFVEGVPAFLENILPMMEGLSEGLREGAGSLVDVGIEFILNLAQGIMDSLPTLLEQLPQIVINISGVINDNAPKLLVGGVKLIYTIIKGIISAVPALIQNFPQIFQAILAVWSALNWLDLGRNVITWIKNGINNLKTQVPNAIKDIGKKAIEFFKGVNWSTAGSQAIQFITSAIRGLASLIPNALKAIGRAAVNAFKSINWLDLGANIIRGIVNGVSSNMSSLVDSVKNAAKKALDGAKKLLGIESPSKVFRREVGAMIPKGLALGIEDTTGEAVKSSESLAKRLYSPFEGLEAPTMEIPTATVEPSRAGNSDEILAAILEFLRLNWPDGEPVPIILDTGQTVGYYDRMLGARAQMARRGVV